MDVDVSEGVAAGVVVLLAVPSVGVLVPEVEVGESVSGDGDGDGDGEGEGDGDVDAEVVALWPSLAVPLVDAGADVDGDVDGDELEGLLLGVDDGVDEGDDVEVALSVPHRETVGVEPTLPETTFDPPGVDAREYGAIAAVTTKPAAVVSKTPPVLRPNDPGRTRAKHM